MRLEKPVPPPSRYATRAKAFQLGSEWKRWNRSCDSAKRVKERDWDFIWFRKRPSFMELHWRWKTSSRLGLRCVWFGPKGVDPSATFAA